MMKQHYSDFNEAIKEITAYMKDRGVLKVYLYGSHARGSESRRSDIDLIVIVDTDKPFFQRYDDFTSMVLDLPMPMDLLIYNPKEWEDIRHRPFFRRALSEGSVIYER